MRILGWLAMILGVVGIVICLVVAIGTWVVKPSIEQTVDSVSVAVTDALTKADALADTAQQRLADAAPKLATAQSTAQQAATSPALSGPTEAAIRSAISDFISGPYTDFKTRWSGLHERVSSINDVVQKVDALIPGITLPGVVTGAVDDMDQSLASLDTIVMGVQKLVDSDITTGQAVQKVADGLTRVQDVMGKADAGLTKVRSDIVDAQQRALDATAKTHQFVDIGAVVVTILFVYLALLHVLLFQQGRRWATQES
jgi:hypothetical protein